MSDDVRDEFVGKYVRPIDTKSAHTVGDRPAIEITQSMIAAGVEVYSNPERYESYEDTVVRIFCAMIECAIRSGAPDSPDEAHASGHAKSAEHPDQ